MNQSRMMNSGPKLRLKLLIDTKEGRVLFAETGKDCVDFLFHILSVPVGSVIKLLKEKGMSGCLSNLYDSIENLNDTYIQSKQYCKDVLLNPKSSLGISSVPFLLLNNVPTQREFYGCSYSFSHDKVSDDPNVNCPDCGRRTLSRKLTYFAPPQDVKEPVAATRGFVKEVHTYMVMDDLVVEPMSAISGIALLNKFNVKDVGALQEKVVTFGMEEALKLVKASLESKTVLTNVFMSCLKEEK